jgi:hypothetical protein
MKSNFYYALLISTVFASCRQEQKTSSASKKDKTPTERNIVSKTPVAVFDQKYISSSLNSDINDWRFTVTLYETPKTFWYRMVVVDKTLEINDTVVFPDLGLELRPALKKGKEPNSCLVGFLDNTDQFLEYKKVTSNYKGLSIKQTKSYYVSTKKMSR